MVHRIKARPVLPMSADATQPADVVSSSTQSTTGVGTNSTIVDPSLDPDPAAASNVQKATSTGSTGGFGFVPSGTPSIPPQSSATPTQQNISSSSSGSAAHQLLQGFYAQSYLSQYAEKNSFDTLAQVTKPTEPKVEWSDERGAIFTLKASKMEYNRDIFHEDTYKQAAQRFFKKIESDLRYTFKDSTEFSIRLIEYNDYPDREFVITRDAEIRHNYETDTWHWWFLDELHLLVKKMDKK
jgi:hypothetical protein